MVDVAVLSVRGLRPRTDTAATVYVLLHALRHRRCSSTCSYQYCSWYGVGSVSSIHYQLHTSTASSHALLLTSNAGLDAVQSWQRLRSRRCMTAQLLHHYMPVSVLS